MNKLIITDFNRTLFDPDQNAVITDATTLLDQATTSGYRLVLLAQAAPARHSLISRLGLAGYFSEILLVPHKTAQLFSGIAGRHRADLTRSFVIGDRARAEIALGARAGWRTIWLQAGRFAGELPYPDAHPTHTVTSLAQVLPLI